MRRLAKMLLAVVLSAFIATNIATAGGYYGGHYRGYHGGYNDHGHHKYDSGDVGLALGFGLLFGTVLGHAMSEPRHDYYYAPRVYRPHRHHYHEYDQPRVVYREVVPSYRTTTPSSRCLQEREYQTTVVIDGKEVEAYGTACLQPDGSWRRGAAKLVPDY
jgi:hypothetical protein